MRAVIYWPSGDNWPNNGPHTSPSAMQMWCDCMDEGLYKEVVGFTRFYKRLRDLIVGGNTSAHQMAHKCKELLIEGKTDYLDQLIQESYHKVLHGIR